jgi:hypothetical protein
MVQFQKSNFSRELPKTKAELRQILAEAVRNTRPSAGRRPKPAPKAEKKIAARAVYVVQKAAGAE